MRVPLRWLEEWITLPESQPELEKRLTLAGLEIEGVERTGPDLSPFQVARVSERKPHPNADRLSVCTVELGGGEVADVVCGAPNVAVGQKVVLARPGSVLPDGTKLKKAKIRGVASEGMICSARELGLGEEHDGILVLDPDTPVGSPASQAISTGETVLDLEITPNRGDWASMLGMAREVRALFGGTVQLPECAPPEGEARADEDIRIEIDDAEGCYTYACRIVRGIEVGPSPAWLRERLEAAGMRALNIVVDVTNLVLLEFGQPLHAFDLAELRGGLIHVRAARPGEKLETLDGQTRELAAEDLVIADGERAVALAGVMGGADTEVREHTRDILIESAHFHPSRIRRTARRLGLHSEASYRFERQVDRSGIVRAADRAARLLCELAGGTVARGTVEACGVEPPVTEEIVLDPGRVNSLLGTELSTEEIVTLLGRVDIVAALDAEARLRCRIPAYRNDLHIPVDLVEEVARIHGYDRIPMTLPTARLSAAVRPAAYSLEDQVRDSLRAVGGLETRCFPGMSEADLRALKLCDEDVRHRTVRIQNPVIEEANLLRTTLLPSLLRAARGNLARQIDRVRLFEVAHIFQRTASGELPDERSEVAMVLTRGEPRTLWDRRDPPPLFFELRGIAENLLADLGLELEFRTDAVEPYLHPGASGVFVRGGLELGCVGELHPEVSAHFGIEVPTGIIELKLGSLEGQRRSSRHFKAVSRHPAVRRDLAVLLDRTASAGEVLESIRKSGGSALVSVELFDRYEGEGIPEGKLSLAFRLIFQRPDRTLKESEIKRMTERVVQTLAHRFGGELR